MTLEKAKAENGVQKAKSAFLDDNKIKFEVWFSMNLGKIPGMEAHHFPAIMAFLGSLGVGEEDSPEKFEEAVFKFGYKKA